jgi:hypothetical protein
LTPPQADAASWNPLLSIGDQITNNVHHQIPGSPITRRDTVRPHREHF